MGKGLRLASTNRGYLFVPHLWASQQAAPRSLRSLTAWVAACWLAQEQGREALHTHAYSHLLSSSFW